MSRKVSHIVSWLFGKSTTPKELLRKNQRVLNRAVRDMDHERVKMEMQEKKIISDIKKMAKEGQIDTVRILAKDLVRTRRYIQRFMVMKANLQAVLIKIHTVQSQHAVSEAMLGVTIALRSMNRQFRMPMLQRILQEFEKQSMMMGVKEDLLTDSIDETVCEAEEEKESDEIVAQILDELGLQLRDQLSELPEAKGNIKNSNTKVPVSSKSANDRSSSIDADLQARLDNLRRKYDALFLISFRNGKASTSKYMIDHSAFNNSSDSNSNFGFPNVPGGAPKKK